MQLSSSTIKAVYKNGYSRIVNEKGKKVPYESEIFREGVAPMVQSSIIAQTFGSPDATAPFCSGQYSVGNSYEMKVANNIWKQGSDHCKWAYAWDSPYACFGDLNRNTYAQTVRGGAFYCINSSHLRNALQSINPSPQTC